VHLSYGMIQFHAYIDPHGHHFEHLFKVKSELSKEDLQKVFANKIKWVHVCIDTRGYRFEHLL
jgi:hypothetical protein